MKTKFYFHKNAQGQSVVEYILLLGVVMAITLGIMRTQLFKGLFGENSVVFAKYRRSIEHAYRHAYPGSLPTIVGDEARYEQIHESYFFDGDTRFFFANQPYK